MTTRISSSVRWLVVTTLASGAVSALAHHPFGVCKSDGADVVCTGGFSDGSPAPGVALEVYDYAHTPVLKGKLGDDSTLRFARPQGPFYVLFDVGPGHTVEVDHSEIR